jgi:hypothetical protein
MQFDSTQLMKSPFLKWCMTGLAIWKTISFGFAVPLVLNEAIPVTDKVIALLIGAGIALAFCFGALQFWKK